MTPETRGPYEGLTHDEYVAGWCICPRHQWAFSLEEAFEKGSEGCPDCAREREEGDVPT